MPRGDRRGKVIVVHSIEQARAAVAAAAALGVPVTLASGPGAGAYLGPLWFRELIDLAADGFPEVAVEAVLDCGDRPGLVLAALQAGLKQVRFSGSRAMAARLGEIAAARGARVITRRLAGLDLLDRPDLEAACHAWLSSGKPL